MAPPISNRWTTHPEYIELLNYLIQKAKDAKSPMSIRRIAREFYEKNGAAQTVYCLILRIIRMRTHIYSFEQIDTNTKVKLIFSLSASVDRNFLKELKKNAVVKVDDKKRITHYKANDESLELNGDHSGSAKKKTAWIESKRSLRSLIINYFETKDDADAIPKNKEEKEMGNLIEFITENCVKVDTPLSIIQLAKDFNNRFSISVLLNTIQTRVKGYCREIQKVEFLDTQTKVQQLFGLSATVDSDCLKELRKNALVDVDEKNRITYYKATDGSLELRGDHSRSAKTKTALLDFEGSHRSMINSYFQKKNDADAVPNKKEEKEMWNLIEFITEKCENVISPLSILQLTKDFNNRFGISVPLKTICTRVEGYCREIQKVEFLNTPSKVKQLFCLSATVASDYLEKLRKDAVVDVDNLNRITKYTANDGSMTLYGEHSRSAKGKLAWIERRKRRNAVNKHSISGGDENEESEKENGYSEDDSDEYSSEEFDSEFDSDDENDPLVEADHMDSSNEVLGFDHETPIRNCSSSEMSINANFDLDPPSEKSHRSEETEIGEDEENDPGFTANPSVKTRSERFSKRRHLDSEVSYNQPNSSSSEVPMATDSLLPKSAKQKKIALQKEQAPRSSNQSRSSSRSMRRSTRNSSFPSTSTDLKESMENKDAQKAIDFENETSIRAPSQIDNDYDFDPPTERAPRPEKTEMREDEEKEHAPEMTANASVKTRYGRLSKRKHLDSEFSYDLANSRNSATPRSTDSSSSKPTKQKKIAMEASSTSNQSTSSSRQIRRSIGRSPSPSVSTESRENIDNQDAPDAYGNPSDHHRPRIQEVTDYEYNPKEDNLPESSTIDNQLEKPKPQTTEEHNTNNEVQNTDRRSDTVAPEPKPEKESLTLQNNQNSTPQTNGNEFITIESHIRLLDSLLPMMKTFETPTLGEDELRIEKTIEKFKEIGNEEEKIRMNEIRTSLMTCLLIVERSAKKEIVKGEDTTSLEKFLISFHQFLVALKMKELDSFVARVKHMMKELKVNDKKFPTKKIQFAFKSIIETIVP